MNEEFTEALDECYFHPSRDGEYASISEKETARKAMELLWAKQQIVVDDCIYSNEEIRSLVENNMMPEILDRALEIYRDSQNVKLPTAYLASIIFRTMLEYDGYIDRLFYQNENRIAEPPKRRAASW